MALSVEALHHGILILPANVPRGVALAQPKHGLDDAQLRGGRVHAGDGHPVVDDHAGANDGAPAVHAPRHERDLQQAGQLVLVLDRGLGVHEAAVVGQRHVAARQDVGGNGLPEDFNAQRVGDDLFRLALEVGVHQRDVVVGADHVAQCGEPLFDALDLDAVWEGVAEVREFLVGRRGWD